MMGSRGFQMVEPPRAASGSAPIQRPLMAGNRVPHAAGNWRPPIATPIATPHRSRSPPSRRTVAGRFQRKLAQRRHQPRHGTGPAEATASPVKPISTRIDYGTESVVTSHITSARSQCKSPLSRPSCRIVPTDGALSAIRASEVGP